MNTDKGKAQQQITMSPEPEMYPTWSPDGTKVAYCRYSVMSHQWEIWTYNLQTSAVTNLVPGKFPQYSRVSNTLVFQRPIESSKERWFALWTIKDDGTNETLVLSSEEEGFITPSWSPDGKRIVFASGGRSEIAKLITEDKDTSKDIDKQVEVIIGKRAIDIRTISADGTNMTQLDSHKGQDSEPRWSQDGRIYFTSVRDGRGVRVCLDSPKRFLSGKLLCLMPLPSP